MEERSAENRNIKRIAVIGPESTGKTTLSEQLASHFNTVWVPEYAREYIEKLNRKYTLEDIITISETQHRQIEERIKKANKFIFVDTEDIINKIWCDTVFRTCPEVIEHRITGFAFDLYLLLMADLPWIEDPVRENPDKREYLYELYKDELINRNLPFEEISGINEARFQNAKEIIRKKF